MAKVVWRDDNTVYIDYIWDMRMNPTKLRMMKL